jgi:beta-mannosidase
VTTNETVGTMIENGADEEPEEGTGMQGMFFRVNGALLMARGANIIPTDQLEGRYSYEDNHNNEAYEILVQSAAVANMNMLRLWGGKAWFC